MDTFSPAERSRIMALVKSKNTTPELYVRKLIHGMGYRFRLHDKTLPGKPDLVLSRLRTVVFVHGCFWHQHSRCKRAAMPTSRIDYWKQKFARNKIRDAANRKALRKLGWRIIVVWECELRRPEHLERRLKTLLSRIQESGK